MRSAANPDHADPAAAKTHITRTRKELIYLYLTASVTYQATLSIPHFSLAEQSGTIDASNSRLVSVIMNFRRKDRTSHMPAQQRTLRRSLALLCVLLGVTGCILPIIPGLPFFVVAARLLGPRDRQLRRAIVGGRQALRRLRTARQPLLRRAGHQLTPHWRSFTRLMLGT